MKLLGISGSLRRDSDNTSLLRAAAELLPPGATLELYVEGLREVPPYAQDLDDEPAPPPVAQLVAAIRDADAVVFSTPEYNHSVPGQLKNVLDWLSRAPGDDVLRDKPILVIGASAGIFGAVWAQAELRKVLGAVGARVIEGELPIGEAHDAFADDGSLSEADHGEALAALLASLVQAADAVPA